MQFLEPNCSICSNFLITVIKDGNSFVDEGVITELVGKLFYTCHKCEFSCCFETESTLHMRTHTTSFSALRHSSSRQ